jgi:hypothetical protein
MHKGHYLDSYYVLARFLGSFARSLAIISIVFRVYVKLTIDPWIHHLQDYPMGRNPNTLVHILGALRSRSGVAIRHVLRKLQSSSDFKVKGAHRNNSRNTSLSTEKSCYRRGQTYLGLVAAGAQQEKEEPSLEEGSVWP